MPSTVFCPVLPVLNERVAYRSFAGDTWDAVITGVPAPGFVDVDLSGPGLKEPYHLRAVRWYDDVLDERPGARPRPS